MNQLKWIKGICHIWSRGRPLSPQCLKTGIWSLAHKSNHRAEISGNIVRYDALAPRPEVLLYWYYVCAYAVFPELKFLPYPWGYGTQCLAPFPLTGEKRWVRGWFGQTVDRHVLECAIFCFRLHYLEERTGADFKRKKNKVGLALAFMHSSPRFHEMCCFNCTYAQSRACVTRDKNGLRRVLMPSLRF